MGAKLRAVALAVSGLVFVLDRLTKSWAVEFLLGSTPEHPYGPRSVEIFGDVVRLTYVENPGMVFGLLANTDAAIRSYLVSGLSVAAIVLLVVTFSKLEVLRRPMLCGLALVVGGALGNLVDRLLYGYVIDFVDVSLYFARWPAFNVADAAIVVGVGLMILDLRSLEETTEASSASVGD